MRSRIVLVVVVSAFLFSADCQAFKFPDIKVPPIIDIIEDIEEGIKNGIDKGKEFIQDTIDDIKEKVDDIVDDIEDGIVDNIEDFVDDLKDKFNDLDADDIIDHVIENLIDTECPNADLSPFKDHQVVLTYDITADHYTKILGGIIVDIFGGSGSGTTAVLNEILRDLLVKLGNQIQNEERDDLLRVVEKAISGILKEGAIESEHFVLLTRFVTRKCKIVLEQCTPTIDLGHGIRFPSKCFRATQPYNEHTFVIVVDYKHTSSGIPKPAPPEGMSRHQVCNEECKASVTVMERTCRVQRGPNNCNCMSSNDLSDRELIDRERHARITCQHGCSVGSLYHKTPGFYVREQDNEWWRIVRDPAVYPHEGQFCGNICNHECRHKKIPELEHFCKRTANSSPCDCLTDDVTDRSLIDRERDARLSCQHSCTIDGKYVPEHLNEWWLRARDPLVYPHEGKFCGNICNHECKDFIAELENSCKINNGSQQCDCAADIDDVQASLREAKALVHCSRGCNIAGEYIEREDNDVYNLSGFTGPYPARGVNCGRNPCIDECKSSIWLLENHCKIRRGKNNCDCLKDIADVRLQKKELNARKLCDRGCNSNGKYIEKADNEWWNRKSRSERYPSSGVHCGRKRGPNPCIDECKSSIWLLENHCKIRRGKNNCDCLKDIADVRLQKKELNARKLCDRGCNSNGKYIEKADNEWWNRKSRSERYPSSGVHCGRKRGPNPCIDECKSSIWQLENHCKIRRGKNNCDCLKDIADVRLQKKELNARKLCDRGCNSNGKYIEKADNEWWNRKRRSDKYPARGKKC